MQSVVGIDQSEVSANKERSVVRPNKGISREIVELISKEKNEPDWMREKRLAAFEIFLKKPIPTWGADLSKLDFDEITFYLKSDYGKYESWKDVPKDVKTTFEKLGIPQAERKFLAGVVGQYESEGFYQSLMEKYSKQGVIFCDTDTAIQKYPEILKEYFMTRCVSIADHKFASLHGAVWSGGSFVYVPAGVKVDLPLQTYFRMNAKNYGQFEHTLIVAEEGSSVHYIEGCTAPKYSSTSMHSAVVEIFVKKNAHVRYTTVQNWSTDVYNLNTKRAIVEEGGFVEWVGGSMGSGVTMLYPASMLIGRGARADHLNIAVGGPNQYKDTGAKVFHGAPDTTSTVVSKSIVFGGGETVYRGLLRVAKGAINSKAHVQCDALMLDDISKSDTVPTMEVFEDQVSVGHEATVGRISEEMLFYLQSRGLTEAEAMAMVVRGFVEPVVKKLPLEYAVELNRLIELEMEGSIG
ncbi:Fe-S cluster assembly protein SufB [Candidatus Curtissbacteria bacterium]|nr:Fe-S cluster assembly protein SufB [Candidatus Curtissbacteria bacterium]